MELQAQSTENKLYYYNVDAILSELIRPPTPKFANLACPRLLKPAPIRPEQLVVAAGSGLNPFVLNDRNEGARNPDPFAMDEDEDAVFVSSNRLDKPSVGMREDSLLELLGKRNRDEETHFVGTHNHVYTVPSHPALYQDLYYPYSFVATQPQMAVSSAEETVPHTPAIATMPILLPQIIRPIAMRPVDVVERYHHLVQKNVATNKEEKSDEPSSMRVCG